MADALFSRTQRKVLSLLFGQPERRFSVTELIALTGSGSGAVQREIKRLVESGLVRRTEVGRVKQYQAEPRASIYDELRGIIAKTSGVATILQGVLEALAPRLALAILYGSVAKERDSAISDIDVLLVSNELTLEEAFAALAPAERRLGRRVSPTLYTSAEFRDAAREEDSFLRTVLSGRHVVLVGDVDGVATTR